MGRTKKPSKSTTRRAPKAEAAAPPPPPTMQELLVKAAQLMASLQYEEAKQATLQALEMAVEKEDTKLCTDSLEILGTIELELGELDQAREVSARFFEAVQRAEVVARGTRGIDNGVLQRPLLPEAVSVDETSTEG